MNHFAIFAAILICGLGSSAQNPKPVLMVGRDGLPTGHASPEGVACDFARAFISTDVPLLEDACLRPFGDPTNRRYFEMYRQKMSAAMLAERHKKKPSAGGPKSILKVFAARHLTNPGPISYASSMYKFKDVKFVDVQAELYSGKQVINRTLVFQDPSGKWFVNPIPSLSHMLSEGLNQEKPSKMDIRSAYTLKKNG